MDRYPEAIDQHNAALSIIHDSNHPLFEAEALNDLGATLRLSGAPQQALEYHQRSIALVRELDHYEHARAHHELALSHYELGNRQTAYAHWRQRLDLTTKLRTRQAALPPPTDLTT